MTRCPLLLLPLLLAACGGAFPDSVLRHPAPKPAPLARRLPVEARFAALDVDHDGVLRRDEAEGHWTEIFDIMDADGDGRISAAEFMALPNPRLGSRDILMEMNDPQRYAAFVRIDSKRQGSLTLDEFLAAAPELFDLLDRDHDGVLDPAELGMAVLVEPPANRDLRLPPQPAPKLRPSEVPPAAPNMPPPAEEPPPPPR